MQHKDLIVKARVAIRTHRPLQGLVAFAPWIATAAMRDTVPMGAGLDRSEGPSNPGEGSA